MEVFRAYHGGHACLLAPEQVVQVEEAGGGGSGAAPTGEGSTGSPPDLELWSPRTEAASAERAVVVVTPAGRARLRCTEPTLTELPPGAAHPLPPLLRDAMGLPHVVGWASLQGRLVWLVDLTRLDRA